MYISVTYLIIIYSIIIIYVFLRYNLDAKPTEHYEIYREKLNISPSEAAYLINKNSENINLILADILTLVEKEYIKIEKMNNEYVFSKTNNDNYTNMKSHEMLSYTLFFEEDTKTIYLNSFLEKLKTNKRFLNNLDLKTLTIKKDIEREFQNQGIIDPKSEKKLFKFNNFAIKLGFSFAVIFIINIFLLNKEILLFSYSGILLSILLYQTTKIKQQRLTKDGANLKQKAKAFKKYLKEYLITQDKPLYMVNVLEYNYTMAIAFGMADLGEDEFINAEYKKIQIKNIIKSILVVILIFILLLLAWFIIKKYLNQELKIYVISSTVFTVILYLLNKIKLESFK